MDFTSSLPLTATSPLLHHSSCSINNLALLSSPIAHKSISSPSTGSLSSYYKRSSLGIEKNTRLWRARVPFFQLFSTKSEDCESLKKELLDSIAPLDRGADANPEQQDRVDQIARKLEAVNKVNQPLKSDLLNGKWELLYTTSQSILNSSSKYVISSEPRAVSGALTGINPAILK